MWKCVKCREKVDDNFEVCWNCGTSRDGVEDPSFRKADDAAVASDAVAPQAPIDSQADEPEKNPIYCVRCDRVLDFVGTKKFHEGTQAWSFLFGDLGELFVNREHFDVYMCPRCGRVELFVDGVGEQFRPH